MKLIRNGSLLATVLAAAIFFGTWGIAAGAGKCDSTPCDPEASEASKSVLAYLAALTDGETRGVISGQNCGNGDEISLGNYEKFIEGLHDKTGKYVGMIGIDYEYARDFSIDELLGANDYLKDYWRSSGLITINWSPTNPWGDANTETDIRRKYTGTDLNLLITPGNPINKKWMRKLDRIAAALNDLQKDGVVVLWRPMQEMNGWWFWWGKIGDHPSYIAVWRHMFDYFTKTKHLHNLLWVFSPNLGENGLSFPYPGDGVVDIVAGTQYSDSVILSGYQDYLKFGKPIGVAECGPSEFSPSVAKGQFDNRLYPQNFKAKYPKVAYWLTWSSWPGVKMAMVDNTFASECLNDPYVINRGDMKLTIRN